MLTCLSFFFLVLKGPWSFFSSRSVFFWWEQGDVPSILEGVVKGKHLNISFSSPYLLWPRFVFGDISLFFVYHTFTLVSILYHVLYTPL